MLTDEEVRTRLDAAFAPLGGGVFTPEHVEKMGTTGFLVFSFLLVLQNRNAAPVGVAAVSGRQIVRFLGLALSTVQRAVSRLEKAGYVRRYPTGGWQITKARINHKKRIKSDRDSRSPVPDRVTSNRDQRDLESRSPRPETVTANRDQRDSGERSPMTANRDHPRSQSAISVTAESGHKSPKLPYPSTTSKGGYGRRSEDVRDGETLQDSSATALAKVHPSPFRFVAYWQDANEERDFGLSFDNVEGLEKFVESKAGELGLRLRHQDLARLRQRSMERFVGEYQKRDRAGKTRGHRVGPARLTEEFVAWLRKDLASAASRASPVREPVTKSQHINADAERRKQRILEAEERERNGETQHGTQRRGLTPR